MRLVTKKTIVGYIEFPQVTKDGVVMQKTPEYRIEVKMVNDNYELQEDESFGTK